MSLVEITFHDGENPTTIAKKMLGANASNKEVAKFRASIMTALTEKGITNDKAIRSGTKIKVETSIFDAKETKATAPDSTPAEPKNSTSEKPKKSTSLDSWMRKVADDKKMKPFDMIAKSDVDADGKFSDAAYTKNVLEVAKNHIELYDKDGDKQISLDEQIEGDLKIAKSEYGSLDTEDTAKITDMAKQTHKFIAAGETGINEGKYLAFLKTADTISKDDGFLTRNEYKKTIDYILTPSTKEAKAFQGRMQESYDEYEKLETEAELEAGVTPEEIKAETTAKPSTTAPVDSGVSHETTSTDAGVPEAPSDAGTSETPGDAGTSEVPKDAETSKGPKDAASSDVPVKSKVLHATTSADAKAPEVLVSIDPKFAKAQHSTDAGAPEVLCSVDAKVSKAPASVDASVPDVLYSKEEQLDANGVTNFIRRPLN